jgi:hypothetical protein
MAARQGQLGVDLFETCRRSRTRTNRGPTDSGTRQEYDSVVSDDVA